MNIVIDGKEYSVNSDSHKRAIEKLLKENYIQTEIRAICTSTNVKYVILMVIDDREMGTYHYNVLKKEPIMKTKFKTVNYRQVLVTSPQGIQYLLDAVSVKTPKGWFLISKAGLVLLDPSQSDLKELKHYKEEGKYCFVNSDVVIFNEPLNVKIGKTISITNVDSLTDIEKTFTVDPWTSMLDMVTGEIYTGLAVTQFLSQLKQEEVDSNTKVLTLTNLSGPDGNLIVKNFVCNTISYLPHKTRDYRITVIGENQNGEPVNFTFSANDRVSLIKPGTDFIINNPSEAIEYIVSNYPQAHSTVQGSTQTGSMSKVEKVVTMFNTLSGKNLTATDIYTITDLILLVDKEG